MWNRNFNIACHENPWSNIYKDYFQISSGNNVKWFQYRILNQILGTRSALSKMNLSTDSLCGLSNIETIQRLMSECPQSNELWSNICFWIKNRINVDVCLSSHDKIWGYVSNNNNFIPLNFTLIHSCKYICWCSKK